MQRIVVHGHRRDIGLGSYPTVSLARTREITHTNRVAVAEGRDPVKEKREVREAARSPSPSIPTFAEAASTVIEECRSGWSNPATRSVLRSLPKVPKVENHHEAIPYSEVPEALAKVRGSTADPITRLAFEFLVLTAARSGEVRKSTWSEIDLGTATWIVPAERMKARKRHRVPLTGQCLEILSQAREEAHPDSGLIFPSMSGRPLSDMTLSALLHRLDIPAVPHGFRSSFKDWCMGTNPEDERWFLSEAALSHPLGKATQKAYARGDLPEQRRPLMEEWAAFCLTER